MHLLRRLERPFAETAMYTYNLWEEGDGNQTLKFVVLDYLELFREKMLNPEWKHQFDLTIWPIFREKMRNPEWKHHFDHTFRPIFYAAGNRLIGPPSSGFGGSAYRKIAGRRCCCSNAVLFRQNLSETESGDPLEPRSDKEARDGRASGLYWYLSSPRE